MIMWWQSVLAWALGMASQKDAFASRHHFFRRLSRMPPPWLLTGVSFTTLINENLFPWVNVLSHLNNRCFPNKMTTLHEDNHQIALAISGFGQGSEPIQLRIYVDKNCVEEMPTFSTKCHPLKTLQAIRLMYLNHPIPHNAESMLRWSVKDNLYWMVVFFPIKGAVSIFHMQKYWPYYVRILPDNNLNCLPAMQSIAKILLQEQSLIN